MSNLKQPREIQTFNAGCLREVSEEVPTTELMELHQERGEIHDLVHDMIHILSEKGSGVGIAAPQLGIMSRVIVIRLDDEQPPIVIINPRILDYTDRNMVTSHEGCLSLPGVYHFVERPLHVTLEYHDATSGGVPREAVFSELEATVLMHEIDHLNGVLFVDRCLNYDQRRLMGRQFRMGKIPKIAANDYSQGI